MGTFLENLAPFALLLILLGGLAIGFQREALRHHRARTADRQASSFVWRA
ncbi:hypothetical protein [Methylobacterium bullatum]|uniref:Uncharacterized protein n=1 Tax=Methylobacterium bullatum TaxID=570505 RepID=A0AAV4ZBV7_9HYPH|nr:hypothetical protein [Methylobacterium bullatum]GJD41351.1 hypothetical protein OICFNHDK_3834 [Methylobacterium bullatum]